MIILAISTSSNICSVSLLEDDKCIQELNISDVKTHSENLMPLIDELLKTSNISLDNISLIACDNGPGSFTGIRIGIATVKALSEAKNIPVITCSSLEALSYNIDNYTGHICSIIDAKNNQVYAGIFNSKHDLIGDYIADTFEKTIEMCNKYPDIIFVGSGTDTYKDVLRNYGLDNVLHAKNVGKCAFHKFSNLGITQSIDNILPMYLKPSQAERMKATNG